MRQMQPVLWTKGLLLTPQHLQIQDRFLEDTLQFQLSSHTFAPWGFKSLVIDHEAIENGRFELAVASGIFPDGLLFDVGPGERDPGPAGLSLDRLLSPDATRPDGGEPDDPLTVYLVVPERRPGGRNTAADGENRKVRYLPSDTLRRDENTGETERPILVGQKNLRLLVDGENLDGYSVLPVARIVRGGAGQLELDASFAPPVIDISASPVIVEIAQGLVEVLTAKSSTLSGTRRERNRGRADFGVSDIANFWLLYSVNTYLPGIRHTYETRRGHPADFFDQLISLGGALTTFATRISPADLPTYDHSDLGGCFQRLDATLRELLDTVVPSTHVSLPFTYDAENERHVVAIDDDSYFTAPEMFLAIAASEAKREDVRRRVESDNVKVSSSADLDRLINQALPGLDVTHTPEPPRALPVTGDFTYFRIERAGEVWDGIRRARNMAAHVPDDLGHARLELLILLPPPS